MSDITKSKKFRLVSVHDCNRGRQAHNMLDYRLGDSVRPWFAGENSDDIDWALRALDDPSERDDAAAYLGLRIVPVS